MPRRSTRSQRSITEWTVRSVLAMLAAGFGYLSVAHSLAYMIRGSDPARAYALVPWDGRITALLSEQLSGPKASAADRKRADELARLALRQDATAVAAVATLGINAQARGDTATARRIFAYSEQLSRRDLRTRLWANEDAVARGDILGALRNYDIAMRTSRIAPDLMFPLLASAIDDEQIRKGLVTILAKRPAWSDQFIGYVSGNGPDAKATALLFEAMQRRGLALPAGSTAALITRLLGENYINDAWRLYAVIRPGANRQSSRDPDFTANPVSTTSFDWQPITDSGVSATIQHGERGGVFDFAVPSTIGGPILRQTQLLMPGNYVLQGRSVGINQSVEALPYWTLTCAEGRELGRVSVFNSTQDHGRFSGRFVVPAGCPIQQLLFVARPSESISGFTGQIVDVRLTPDAG